MSSDHPTARGWGREPGGVPLDFAIIGAQKSASTFMQRRLAGQPDITVLKDESRHFEDPYYGRGGMRELTGLLEPHRHTLTGVKRPDYLPKPAVPARVAEHVPRIKLIAVLREPVSRAVSAYFHLAAFGFVPVMDPSTAIGALLDGTLQQDYPKTQEILEYGRYAAHLRRWHESIPAKRFLVLLQEDVARDPAGSLTTVLRFLEAAETVVVEDGKSHNAGVYWPPRVRLRAARSRRYYDYDTSYGQISPKRLGPLAWGMVAGITAVDKLVLNRLGRDTRPSIDTAVEHRLREYYASDVRDLATLLDRDLAAWQVGRR
ncbi:MAG: sulfotransferase domain-containing protein [Geodermatophilaceae bacterium]|nr:sulfotransferase domain-containing protein [Geodermatophilaceae bacterium]